MKKLTAGDVIYARTHADFLNKVFGKNYRQWMKSVWNYDENTIVWMVHFDGASRSGWKNEFINGNLIKETNVWRVDTWNGRAIDWAVYKKRIVIEVRGGDFFESRSYVFRGVFKADEDKSDPYTVRYYEKISDEFIV